MVNKIKILFLEPHLSTGGGPAFVLKRIEALANNLDFELFVVEWADVSWEYVVQKNKIKKLIKPENFYTLDNDKSILIDIIKNNKIDILHTDEMIESYGMSVDLLNKIYDNNRTWKIVETCHNVWFDPNISKKFNPDAYAFCTPYHQKNAFLNTPSYNEVLQFPIENRIPTNDEKIKAKISLGMDLNKKHIINIGLWTRGKNQGEGVEIARSLLKTNPEIQFHFIGNQAPNFEDYWKPIMNNIPSNVTIWGERDDTDVFLDAADIFMFNSILECNPLVLKESISHGLKILSRNLPQYMDIYTKYITEINDDITISKYKLLMLLNTDKTYEITDDMISFSERYSNFYKKILNQKLMMNDEYIDRPTITHNFINQPFLEITGNSTNKFKIEFSDENNVCLYSNILPINHWVKLNREYYTKWNAKVYEIINNDETLIYDETLNLKNKRVYISFESKSLGDNLLWIPYVKEFKDKHQCELTVSTFLNYLFIETYPDINFIEPGSVVNNIYAMYKIGLFYDNDVFNQNMHPCDFKYHPLQKVAADILGLEYKEIRPLLKIPNVIKKKKVGIGIHSTCQAKYWNNENGWQEVVNYLNNQGYEVVLYSNENNGYMGNFKPSGVTQFEPGDINRLIDDMASCEFFIGLSSGLIWLAWALKLPAVLISGFSYEYNEPTLDIYRVINKNVCNGCVNRYNFDRSDWNWCPDNKGTDKQFECTKQITSEMVIDEIKKI